MYDRIKGLREDMDIRQKDIAKILSIAQTTYSDYELGKLNIPIPILIQLAEFYETSVDYLLRLTDVKTPYPKSKS